MARAALSLPFSGLHGALGDLVLVQRPDGPVVRRRTITRRGSSPAQRENEARLAQVGRAWRELDDATFAAWGRYAETRAWRNPATGAIVTPKAFNVFCGLASKARQVDPARDLSAFGPPGEAFFGDGVVVTVGSGPLPLPPLQDEPLGEGVLLFSGDRGNAPGIVTEFLVQPLANARRKAAGDKYVSAGFAALRGEAVAVGVRPGAYACAYRFVRAATGQETGVAPIGTVVVGA